MRNLQFTPMIALVSALKFTGAIFRSPNNELTGTAKCSVPSTNSKKKNWRGRKIDADMGTNKYIIEYVHTRGAPRHMVMAT